MSIFVADTPIQHDMRENIRARRYLHLSHKDVLSSHKGRGTLCLDAAEYERILRHVPTPLSVLESAAVAEKDKKIALLHDELLCKTNELEKLVAENASLKQDCADLKKSTGTARARSESSDNLHANRAPFWLVAIPLILRLHQEAKTSTVYSKDTIQAEFERELENYPAFKDSIKDILSTEKKIKENTPFALEGWGMRAIRAVLHEYGVNTKNTPGPESKK